MFRSKRAGTSNLDDNCTLTVEGSLQSFNSDRSGDVATISLTRYDPNTRTSRWLAEIAAQDTTGGAASSQSAGDLIMRTMRQERMRVTSTGDIKMISPRLLLNATSNASDVWTIRPESNLVFQYNSNAFLTFTRSNATFAGDISAQGNLAVAGVTTFSNLCVFSSNVTVFGNSVVHGTSVMSNGVVVTGPMNLFNTLNVSGLVTASNIVVSGTQIVNGSATFSNDVTSMGPFVCRQTSSVSGIASFGSNISLFNASSNAVTIQPPPSLTNYTFQLPPALPSINGVPLLVTSSGTSTFSAMPIQTAYANTTQVTALKLWTGSMLSQSSNTVTFFPTSDGTSNGTALFSNILFVNATPRFNTSNIASSSVFAALSTVSSDNKQIRFTLATGVITSIVLLGGFSTLTSPASPNTPVWCTIIGL
jgi:hypothetical protein